MDLDSHLFIVIGSMSRLPWRGCLTLVDCLCMSLSLLVPFVADVLEAPRRGIYRLKWLKWLFRFVPLVSAPSSYDEANVFCGIKPNTMGDPYLASHARSRRQACSNHIRY